MSAGRAEHFLKKGYRNAKVLRGGLEECWISNQVIQIGED
jgi:hypothetical protein